MRPLDFDLDSKRTLRLACASRLSRHVGVIELYSSLSAEELSLLARCMPNLRCNFRGAWSSLVFPARLRTLIVQFQPSRDHPAPFSDEELREIDAAIAVIARLPQLETLHLSASTTASCCLTPLIDAPALHTLSLSLLDRQTSNVIQTLRNMSHLRSLRFTPSAAQFALMLLVPHTMKLETFDLGSIFTAEFHAAIVQLPTLTDLSINLCSPHTDFLRQLPNLRGLRVFLWHDTVEVDTDRIMHSLHSLKGLTELGLYGEPTHQSAQSLRITSDHLVACLAHMPLLTSLHLSGAASLDSLRFLSSGPITHSLKKLQLSRFEPRLPLRELHHVHELSSLTELRLYSVFDRPLDDYSEPLYTPPSRLMPSLVYFDHGWKPAAGGEAADSASDEEEEKEEEEEEENEEGEEEGEEEEDEQEEDD
jgi:hypothetical protein